MSQNSQPLTTAQNKHPDSLSPSTIPPGALAMNNALQLLDVGEELGIDEENRPAPNGPLVLDNDNHYQKLPENYTYIPMPIMDWSPPVEALFVSQLFCHNTAFPNMVEIDFWYFP